MHNAELDITSQTLELLNTSSERDHTEWSAKISVMLHEMSTGLILHSTYLYLLLVFFNSYIFIDYRDSDGDTEENLKIIES